MANTGEARVGAFPEELPTRTFAALQRVCRELGAELRSLQHDQPEPLGVHVLVGCLGPGERRIRPHYLERAGESESLSLLLLAEDQLTRPTVALEQGRVTLIEQSSHELLRARLRMLLGGETGEGTQGERVTARFWVADTHGSRDASTARVELSFDGQPAHLELLDADWRLQWPVSPRSLWLISPLRLPRTSDLSVLYGGGGERVLPAQSGDVALVLGGSQDVWPSDVVRELSRRSEFGGPNIFDWACARFGGKGGRVAAVEVR